MPKWKCEGCRSEFWGWGVYYKLAHGSKGVCPECGGTLDRVVEIAETREDTLAICGDSSHAA